LGGADFRSEQAGLDEFRLDDIAVEGLHDVFVGARSDAFLNMRYIILGRAEHDDRFLPSSVTRSARKYSMPLMTSIF
jgi:hypothetical protein